MSHKFITERLLAAELGVRPETLRKWRASGVGPAYHKLGRTVRYGLPELEGWLASRSRGRDTQNGGTRNA